MVSFLLFLALPAIILANSLESPADATYNIVTSQTAHRFDGIGAISGGGAIARFLPEYKEKYRNQILDLLFKPYYGASLHLLKVEIGSDAQSTEGSESTHWRNRWDVPTFDRGYEFWMLKEAKKRNNDILTWALPWGFPGWLGETSDLPLFYPYGNRNDTADYVVSWLKGARDHHQVDVDFVGIWNEKPYDAEYIRTLRKTLNRVGLDNVSIVANDNHWEIIDLIEMEPDMLEYISVIGAHYPGTHSPQKARNVSNAHNIPLWSSEDDSTTSTRLKKTGCIARILNQNYVRGEMTSTIIWNVISAFYAQLDYPDAGLIKALEPWSGNFIVDSVMYAVAHTTQFTQPGWHYLARGNGSGLLKGGGSYVTLVDGANFTLIVETAQYESSECVRPVNTNYNVTRQVARFNVEGLVLPATLFVRYTQIGGANVFEKRSLTPLKNVIEIDLQPDEIWTVSTVGPGSKPSFQDTRCALSFPLDYVDDFENTTINEEGRYFIQQSGAFEVVALPEGGRGLQQQTLTPPVTWCPLPLPFPITLIGGALQTNLNISVSVRQPIVNGSSGVILATRVAQGGCFSFISAGVFVNWDDSGITVCERAPCIIPKCSTRKFRLSPGVWRRLEILVENDDSLISVDGVRALECRVSNVISPGFVGLGTLDYGLMQYDNLSILKYTFGTKIPAVAAAGQA